MWFNIKNNESSVDVQILDEIGGYGVTGKQFISELKDGLKADDKVNLLINSPGGSVIEGNLIYNEIVNLSNHVTAEVSGMAASMASIIAMAADKVLIHENSYLMIHNPWTLAMGDSDELRKTADLMDGMKNSAIKAYQRHSELSEDKISEMMDEETWMSGLDAVAMGFAHEMLEPLDIAAVVKEIPESVKALVINDMEPKEDESTEADDAPADETDINTADADADTESDTGVEEEPSEPSEPSAKFNLAEIIDTYEAKLAKQAETVKSLQSERDKARAELDTLKAESASEIEKIASELNDVKERLSTFAAPGFTFDGDSQYLTWNDAFKELGYEEARKQHPELYKQFMETRNKK